MEISREQLLWMYRTMATIRRFEERAVYEVGARHISGAVHSSAGQEAVPTGVSAHLTSRDYIASTHRGHGHSIAKGVDPRRMMAELFGQATGSNGGKGGSMHIADMEQGMLGANGVVGASVPLAVGAALAARIRGEDRVAVAFFGDGGANQGVLHESMNLAAIWRLPVVFLCENNLYAESTAVEYALSVPNVADRAVAYGMPGLIADGMDVLSVFDAAGQAVGRARSGQGPTLLECKTYRYQGHTAADNPRTYRTAVEEAEYRNRDPLRVFLQRVRALKLMPQRAMKEFEQQLATADKEVDGLIDEAVRFADQSPPPEMSELYTDVYVDFPLDQLKRGASMLA